MIGAVESMPIFTASAPKSESTEWICVPMNSGGRLKTPWTPTEFCAVTAVITLIPKTRKAEKVLRSAWMPAPPPESEPAMVNALGTTIDPRSIRRTEGPLKRRPGAVEHEPVGGHGGDGQGRHERRRPGHRHHRDPLRARLADEQEAGVRDARGARVGHERDRAAAGQLAQQLRPTRELVVLEVAHGPLVNVEMREERTRPARVLAGDQVHFAQDAQRAQGDVLEVADRSRDDEERAAQATPTALALPRRAGAARGSG